MSKHHLNLSPAFVKHLLYIVAVVLAIAVFLPLSKNGTTLHAGIRRVNAAEILLRPRALLQQSKPDAWHTEGNRILDAHHRPVRISGVNWSGFETKEAVPGGLEAQDYRTILNGVKGSGFNTVRLPFSNAMVESPFVPGHVGYSNSDGSINTDLQGLNSLEIMDKIVAYSSKIGLRIILDNHRSEAGSSAEENGLWYTESYPESAWINDWTALANRYKNNPAVVGMDLRNEPHNATKGGSCWDCGGDHDWHRAATRAGNAILAVNPHLLIFVEGVDTYAGDSYWWGGNLEGVRHSPIHLSVPNHLVYSAHEYGPTEYAQPWFSASTTPASLAAIWRRHWAFISDADIAPVWIGEFGTSNDEDGVQSLTAGSEGQWFQSLVQFLAAHPALNWTYWGINGEDRYGLLDASYGKAANSQKAAALASLRMDLPASSGPETPAHAETYAAVPTTFAPPAVAAPRQQAELHSTFVPEPQLATKFHSISNRTHPAVAAEHDSVESVIAASTRLAVSRAAENLPDDSTEGAR